MTRPHKSGGSAQTLLHLWS